jgi:hypothetical protein
MQDAGAPEPVLKWIASVCADRIRVDLDITNGYDCTDV